MKCSELENGRQVVFKIYSDIYKKKIPECGTVVFVGNNRREVYVSWLEGYKDRGDAIPFEDMLAAYDKDGEMMHFENIKGPSILLSPE